MISNSGKNKTENTHVEYRLHERERFLRTLIGNLPGVVYRCRVDENFTSEFLSDGCFDLTGYTSEELVTKRLNSWDDIIHQADRERVRAEIRALISDGSQTAKLPLETFYRILNRDGSARNVRDRFRFIFDESGSIVALEGFIIDITEQTKAEERVREADMRYRLLAENIHDLVCLHNLEGRYLYVSPSSYALLGYAPEQLVGKSPYDFIHPEELVCVRDDTHAQLLEGSNNLTVNYRIRRSSGDYVWLESMAQIVRDEKGNIVQLLTVSRDITSRKIAEAEQLETQEEIAQLLLSEQSSRAEAEAAHQEAERANRAKDEFLQLISHEFRTPLTTIKMLARVMQQNTESPAEREEYLETIAAECDRQIDMILNLLDVARMEEGSMDLRSEKVDINRLLRSCEKIERHAAIARRQTFNVEYDESLPFARGDEKAIRRALCSIIENAIKYTALGGEISLAAKFIPPVKSDLVGDSDSTEATNLLVTDTGFSGEIVITVTDTGRGIHAEDVPKLFQKFYRGTKPVPHDHTTDGTPDDAMGRAETPGVGLGLYLSKKLIAALGGHIEVTSEVGRGSTFSVHLAVWNETVDMPDEIDAYGFDEGDLK